MFNFGDSYTREEIHSQVGGSLQSYLPHVGKRVVAACLRPDANPGDPDVILVGTGDGIEHAAELLIAQHAAVPTFLKLRTDNWKYVGEYEVDRWSQDSAELAEQARVSGRDNITRVIRMAPTLAPSFVKGSGQFAKTSQLNLDPFDVQMVFLRIGWMDRYRGISGGDVISSGGAYVAEHGFGHEIFNFQQFDGAVYGYVQPRSRKDQWEHHRINLTRLGASSENNSVSGVLAVWVATEPSGGGYLVGWYKNATVYRDRQPPPTGSGRRHSGTDCGYFVTARAEDAVLLPPIERVLPIPQKGKGNFGQSNVWYADDPDRNRDFRVEVLRYIETRLVSKPPASNPSGVPRQPDPFRRQKIERVAIEFTTARFEGMGYKVDSFERDNIGWDLEAALGNRKLRLEVKGLSASQIVIELTPNEYAAMREHRDSFRVCVVTNALTEPKLVVFGYSPDSGQWESDGRQLNVQERVAARCSSD